MHTADPDLLTRLAAAVRDRADDLSDLSDHIDRYDSGERALRHLEIHHPEHLPPSGTPLLRYHPFHLAAHTADLDAARAALAGAEHALSLAQEAAGELTHIIAAGSPSCSCGWVTPAGQDPEPAGWAHLTAGLPGSAKLRALTTCG